LADYFLKREFASYAIELEGFGDTKAIAGHVDSFNVYFRDISRLRDIIKKERPDKKIFIIGESLGGLIAFLLAADNPGLFDGLVCISPSFKSRLAFPTPEFLRILISALFNPTKQFDVPFDSAAITQDEACKKAIDADPLEHRFATASLLFNSVFAMWRAGVVKNQIAVPVLFLLADDNDALVDTVASKRIFAALEVEDKKLIQYPGMRHALSIEKDRERVFEEMLRWLEEKI
jgi:lysophospholipase